MLISFVKFFLNPFNILWLLAISTIVIWYLDKKKLLRWFLYVLTIYFLIISTPLIPGIVINTLEDRYEPLYVEQLENPKAEYHIVVLGGGHGIDDRLPPNSQLSLNALGRLNEAIRLYRQLPNSKLILSGYSASGRTTQAKMLQKTALLLGVNEEATLLQNEPGNTYEEAMVYTENYGPTYPIILVTSAVHMPRAMQVFKQFGTDPIASPTNYRLRGSWKQKWAGLPSIKNIENMSTGIYEYTGMIWYSMRQ